MRRGTSRRSGTPSDAAPLDRRRAPSCAAEPQIVWWPVDSVAIGTTGRPDASGFALFAPAAASHAVRAQRWVSPRVGMRELSAEYLSDGHGVPRRASLHGVPLALKSPRDGPIGVPSGAQIAHP